MGKLEPESPTIFDGKNPWVSGSKFPFTSNHWYQFSHPIQQPEQPKRSQPAVAVPLSRHRRQELCMESTHYGVTLGHLDSNQLQLLLDEAIASWRCVFVDGVFGSPDRQVWRFGRYGYGSIPIFIPFLDIFRGMNIHKSQLTIIN